MVQCIPRQLWSGLLTSLFFNLSYDFLTNLTLWETNKKQKKNMFLICLRCILFSSIAALSGSHWISKVCLVFCKKKIVYLLFPIESVLHISLYASQRCRKLFSFGSSLKINDRFPSPPPPPPPYTFHLYYPTNVKSHTKLFKILYKCSHKKNLKKCWYIFFLIISKGEINLIMKWKTFEELFKEKTILGITNPSPQGIFTV